MAKVTRSDTAYSIHIRSEYPVQGSMTVWALRDFVRALDEAGIPDNAPLTAEHNHDTRHLSALWLRHTVTVEPAREVPDGR
jgi:hypothetical protein